MDLRDHPTVVRFRRWAEQQGSAEAAGRAIALHGTSCTGVMVGYMANADRFPGRLLSHAIERATADWPDGAIQAEEWDAVERARSEAKRLAPAPADASGPHEQQTAEPADAAE